MASNTFKFVKTAVTGGFQTRLWIGEQTAFLNSFTPAAGTDATFLGLQARRADEKKFVQVYDPADGVFHLFCPFKNELGMRNMPILRVDKIQKIAKERTEDLEHNSNLHVTLIVNNDEEAVLAGLAVARNWPIYDKRTVIDDKRKVLNVTCDFLGTSEEFSAVGLQNLVDGIRNCARLMDHPCEEMRTSDMVREARETMEKLNVKDKRVTMEVIEGEELKKRGFGGIYGVGKAASKPPALVILTYTPPVAPVKTVALVGKGIVYDTGGLSIKATAGMCEMKFDKGGACAILNAFKVLSDTGSRHKIHALLCLAENAVGPDSFRNDDILTLYSGKTVEINNTDAEGRLVLGDGVAYASKELKPDLIVDMATLTGAQLIATGLKHAGLVTSSEEMEQLFFKSGLTTGDLCFPMLYCLPLLKKQFKSEVADMKNSVADRFNAQSSCAGHFVEMHLAESYKGKWVHVDIAGPSVHESRGTGFGVALLVQVVLNF